MTQPANHTDRGQLNSDIPALTDDQGQEFYLLEHINSILTDRNSVEPTSITFRRSKCDCELWFCPECGARKAAKERKAYLPVLNSFRHILMITLTVDPSLFISPEDAYEYLASKRCVAEFLRKLRKHGVLITRRYCYRLEFQEGNGMPHYHVLVEARFISHDLVSSLWNGLGPRQRTDGDPRKLGFVYVTAKNSPEVGRTNAESALDYILNTPEEWPAWVMDKGGLNGRIRLTSTGGGFWPPDTNPKPPTPRRRKPYKPRSKSNLTYRKLAERCLTKHNVFMLERTNDLWTGEFRIKRTWLAELELQPLHGGEDSLHTIALTEDFDVESVEALVRQIYERGQWAIRINRASADVRAVLPIGEWWTPSGYPDECDQQVQEEEIIAPDIKDAGPF